MFNSDLPSVAPSEGKPTRWDRSAIQPACACNRLVRKRQRVGVL